MTPYIVLAFANDHARPTSLLRNLPEEWREIQGALLPAVDAGRCRLIELPFATAGSLIAALQRDEHRDRIALLHFAGHADSYQLLLESAEGAPAAVSGAGLAEFLGHTNGLQLVFLNGCATRGHVQRLLDAGVPAVISTSRAVDDAAARHFAAFFYGGLGQALGVREAFEQAVAAMRAARPGADGTSRHLYAVQPEDEERLPWELSVREGAERVELWTPGTPPLPPVPPRDLPESPFRHLQRFTREHAELLFGREHETWELYGRVVAPDAPPVVLLYGQAGVGKSSLLEAGLLPRLEGAQAVRYARRDPALGLLDTLARAVGAEAPATAEEAATAWRLTEAECRQPLLVILDQVEEAFTRAAEPEAEVAAFAAALGELFRDRSSRPRGKLVLGFRKEWLAEVESALREAEVPRKAQFLPPLTREGVVAAITGVERSRRLREHYGLSIEKGLPERIAADLLRDEDSHLAPLLQILLFAMWEAARRHDRQHPRFDGDLYESLTLYRAGQEGRLLLDDFLGQQLTAIGASHPGAVESGLALDFLAFHTTRYGTARERTREEGAREYPHQADVIGALRRELTDLYLLTDSPVNDDDRPAATRLAHDTLAPLVRRRFEESVAPGQRARRILEARVADWTEARTGTPLDEADLASVEHGAGGMRAWTDDEQRLVDASRDRREQEHRAQRRRRNAAILAAMLVLVSSVIALAQWHRSAQGRAIAESRELAAQANFHRQRRPELALLMGVAAYERSPTLEARAALGSSLADLSARVHWILRNPYPEVRSVTFSADGKRLATAEAGGTVILWDLHRGRPTDTLLVPAYEFPDQGRGRDLREVAFSRDGRWLATRSITSVKVWDAHTLRLHDTLRTQGNWVEAISLSADGHLLAASLREEPNGIILWNLASGEQERVGLPGSGGTLLFSPRTPLLAIAEREGTVWIVDVETGHLRRVLEGRSGSPETAPRSPLLAFSPRGSYLAVSSADTLYVLETDTWRIVSRRVFDTPLRVDGREIIFASDSLLAVPDGRSIYLMNFARPAHPSEQTLRAHPADVTAMALSPDGKTLASSDGLGTTVLWNLAPRRPWRVYDATRAWWGAFSGPEREETLPDGKRPAALSPTADVFAIVIPESAAVVFWELAPDRRSRRTLPRAYPFLARLTFSHNGERLAFADTSTLLLWDREGRSRMVASVPAGEFAPLLALDEDGEQVAAGRSGSSLRFWRAGVAEPFDSVRPDSATFVSVAYSRNGRLLATGDNRGRIQLWDLAVRKRLNRTLLGHSTSVTRLMFSRDGDQLASGDDSGAILLWNLSSGSQTGSPLPGSGAPISALAFDSDGALLASADLSGAVSLWDVEQHLLLSSSIIQHRTGVDDVAFAVGDRVLVSAGYGIVEQTDVSPAAWIERACRIANGEAYRDDWNRFVSTHAFPRSCRQSGQDGPLANH